MMRTLFQAYRLLCFVISSFHLIEQCRHTQNRKEKESEIQHAQSNERERLMVQKNCTVCVFFLVQIEHTKRKERIIAVHIRILIDKF